MLKEYNDFYFSFRDIRFVKLKKNYIAELKDIADLTIVDERCNTTDE